MYRIEGLRKSGKEFVNELSDYNIAKFEYDCVKCVTQWVTLYEVNGDNMNQLDVYIGG